MCPFLESVALYVNGCRGVQVLLPADRIDSESQAEGKVGKVWGLFSDCITMKAIALKVCKRGSHAVKVS